MTDEINVMLMYLPMTVGAFTVFKDGIYTVIVNANLSEEARMREYKKEEYHIKKGDFQRRCSADLIEIFAHGLEG